MSEELILSPHDVLWHERRRQVYTASDMGVLFGLPGFASRTLSDVWHEKRYGLEADKSTPSTRLGQRMEPIILDEAEEVLGKIIDRQKWMVSGSIGATLDGRREEDGRPVEAKTAGLLWKADEEWGDSGDEIPSSIILQVQAQLLVTEADLGYVPAIIGGRGFVLFEVGRQESLIKDMKVRVADFLQTIANDAPPPEPPQLETLKRLRREPGSVTPRSDELDAAFERYQKVNETAKAAEKVKEEAQRTLLAMLAGTEAAECRDGMITYYQQTRRESYTPASTFRVMRFKKGK